MSAVSVTLTQRKIVVGPLYGVQEQATKAAPAKLGTPFVMSLSVAPDRERMIRVANDADLGMYVANPLDKWGDGTDDFVTGGTAAAPGDVLVIDWPPGTWDPSFPSSMSFNILAVGSGRLTVDVPFWENVAGPFYWHIVRSGITTIRTGTQGFTERHLGIAVSTFLCDRAVVMFTDVQDALDHLVAVQASVSALEVTVASEPDLYRNNPPGNPVVTVYSS